MKDDPALSVYPEHGTWSPYLVEAIRVMFAQERACSGMIVRANYLTLDLFAPIIWERNEHETNYTL